MKKLLLILSLVFVPQMVVAATWCQWNPGGPWAFNCQTDANGPITDASGIKFRPIAGTDDNRGFYRLIETRPEMTDEQTYDEVVWTAPTAGNNWQIGKTWTVRDKSADELDADAVQEHMSKVDFCNMKHLVELLISKGTFTQAEFLDGLHPKHKRAFVYWNQQTDCGKP